MRIAIALIRLATVTDDDELLSNPEFTLLRHRLEAQGIIKPASVLHMRGRDLKLNKLALIAPVVTPNFGKDVFIGSTPT